MHSSLKDEGGINVKPVMVTAKRAVTAETRLFHCVSVGEKMSSVAKLLAHWRHKHCLGSKRVKTRV